MVNNHGQVIQFVTSDLPSLEVTYITIPKGHFFTKKKGHLTELPGGWNFFFQRTGKWLITMVIVSPITGVVPLINGHSWLINGGY